MVQPIPSLHQVQAKADELNRAGYDVHTMNVVLWDGHIWQVRLEATDQDLEDHVFLYALDLYGYNIEQVEAHYR